MNSLAQTDLQSWLSFDRVTVVGLLLTCLGLIVLGLLNQWWVPGWLYKLEKENSAKWEAIAQATQKELRDTAVSFRDLSETIKKMAERK